jgi:sulfite reductase alpha subunit-like flavoprotein
MWLWCTCLQDVAERIAREAQLLLYSPAVLPMDSYPMQQLPEERFVIFVTATTGQARKAVAISCMQ